MELPKSSVECPAKIAKKPLPGGWPQRVYCPVAIWRGYSCLRVPAACRSTNGRHTRESGYQVRRGLSVHHWLLWNTGSPAFAGDDSQGGCARAPSHSRGAMRPRFAGKFLTLEKEGAGKAGCALHPRSRVQKCMQNAHEHTGSAEAFRPSPRNGFNGFLRALPGDRALLPPSLKRITPPNLTPASGCQDHTTSPSARAAPRQRAALRPPHPAANVRDDRETPL
jgi:hypothetical protein